MGSFGGGIVGLAVSMKDVMGALAVLIAIAAYGIYVWKTLRGDARPHPLSWLIFGVLTGTGYLVQLDQKAGPGNWVMAITTLVCLMLCVMSFWRGERTLPWYEWAFLGAAIVVFAFYLWSRNPGLIGDVVGRTPRDLLIRHAPTISSMLAAFVNVLGFGPTVAPPAQRQRQHFRAQQFEIRAVVLCARQHFGRDLRVSGNARYRQCRRCADYLSAAAAGKLAGKFVVFPGHLHRSAMMHFSHSGRRATHT
jgi:hypothetical protein